MWNSFNNLIHTILFLNYRPCDELICSELIHPNQQFFDPQKIDLTLNRPAINCAVINRSSLREMTQ
jgi:hypothetical protein